MAIAALGEGAEWPARVVHALSLLPDAEGAPARVILEEALDSWAEELGLDPLSPAASPPPTAPDADPAVAEEESASALASSEMDGASTLDVTEDLVLAAPPVIQPLDDPIAHDELERAFAEAETRTEEMHDVNRVAERVLMDEPIGLAELSGEVLDPVEAPAPIDVDPFDVSGSELALETGSIEEVLELDAAVAEPAIWPGTVIGERRATGSSLRAEPAPSFGTGEDSFEVGAEDEGGRPARARVLATLEQWLDNLETRRQGRPGRAR